MTVKANKRLLGPALLAGGQARLLMDGAEIIVQADKLYPAAWRRAGVGDCLWVREPYIEIKGYVQHCDVHEFVVGSIPWNIGPDGWKQRVPEWLRPWLATKCKTHQHNGADMWKGLSRAILEVVDRQPNSLRCIVKMQTVADFLGVPAT